MELVDHIHEIQYFVHVLLGALSERIHSSLAHEVRNLRLLKADYLLILDEVEN